MVIHISNPGVFIASMTPLMIFFGMRHALDVDHITAIDNLVRMHNVRKRARWVGTAILAGKVVGRTHFLGPIGSSAITGLIFGFGFDTATQISALTISAVASATAGIEIAMTLAVIFAMGMIFVDSM